MCSLRSLRSLALNYRRVKQATALSRVFNNQPRGIIIGERAKRARRYLVMFMETRDIYYVLYVRLFLIRMSALVFCQLSSRARKRKTF